MADARKALIVQGGWDGHEPKQVAEVFRRVLVEEGFAVEVADTLDAFKDQQTLMGLSLIVPVWTMGKISGEQVDPVLKAVESGVGLAGCHGGMCDSFRECTEWQWMTGGQWVAHPGNDGVKYTVEIGPEKSEITEGIEDFEVASRAVLPARRPGGKGAGDHGGSPSRRGRTSGTGRWRCRRCGRSIGARGGCSTARWGTTRTWWRPSRT